MGRRWAAAACLSCLLTIVWSASVGPRPAQPARSRPPSGASSAAAPATSGTGSSRLWMDLEELWCRYGLAECRGGTAQAADADELLGHLRPAGVPLPPVVVMPLDAALFLQSTDNTFAAVVEEDEQSEAASAGSSGSRIKVQLDAAAAGDVGALVGSAGREAAGSAGQDDVAPQLVGVAVPGPTSLLGKRLIPGTEKPAASGLDAPPAGNAAAAQPRPARLLQQRQPTDGGNATNATLGVPPVVLPGSVTAGGAAFKAARAVWEQAARNTFWVLLLYVAKTALLLACLQLWRHTRRRRAARAEQEEAGRARAPLREAFIVALPAAAALENSEAGAAEVEAAHGARLSINQPITLQDQQEAAFAVAVDANHWAGHGQEAGLLMHTAALDEEQKTGAPPQALALAAAPVAVVVAAPPAAVAVAAAPAAAVEEEAAGVPQAKVTAVAVAAPPAAAATADAAGLPRTEAAPAAVAAAPAAAATEEAGGLPGHAEAAAVLVAEPAAPTAGEAVVHKLRLISSSVAPLLGKLARGGSANLQHSSSSPSHGEELGSPGSAAGSEGDDGASPGQSLLADLPVDSSIRTRDISRKGWVTAPDTGFAAEPSSFANPLFGTLGAGALSSDDEHQASPSDAPAGDGIKSGRGSLAGTAAGASGAPWQAKQAEVEEAGQLGRGDSLAAEDSFRLLAAELPPPSAALTAASTSTPSTARPWGEAEARSSGSELPSPSSPGKPPLSPGKRPSLAPRKLTAAKSIGPRDLPLPLPTADQDEETGQGQGGGGDRRSSLNSPQGQARGGGGDRRSSISSPSSQRGSVNNPSRRVSLVYPHSRRASTMALSGAATAAEPRVPRRSSCGSVHQEMSTLYEVTASGGTPPQQQPLPAVAADDATSTAAGGSMVSHPLVTGLRGVRLLTTLQFHEEVKVGQLLGVGAAGCVYQATYGGQQVAVKIMHPTRADDRSFSREVEVMAAVGRHPFIIGIMAACLEPPCLAVVQELAATSLYDQLHTHQSRPLYGTFLQLAEDIATALEHCHAQRPPVVHRDLSTRNVLVGLDGRARIADFGLATTKRRSHLSNDKAGALGTAAFMAPEAMTAGKITERCDTWAFGIILWELLTGREAWGEFDSPLQIIYAVGVERRRLPIPPGCPPPLATLLKECWRHNAPMRPSFTEILMRLRSWRSQDAFRHMKLTPNGTLNSNTAQQPSTAKWSPKMPMLMPPPAERPISPTIRA